ncbi:MAG TPA: alpha/beta hydrolase [Nitriliruptorales bacterium]|nr:alpha/beta hydrolase [Nitriliruptorales bacterium]
MANSFLLVHSPLLGPSSWAATAGVLVDRGCEVAVPGLTGVAEAAPPLWQRFIDGATMATERLQAPIVVVGHSGAGAFLPAIAEHLGDRLSALVFVDAVVPPHGGAHETPSALQSLLDEQTVDGRLRRWLDWWPEDVVGQLLPDPSERELLRRDMPQLPRSYFDEAVPVPDDWSRRPCAFLKLSHAYQAEYVEAGARGWTRQKIDGNHLSILTEPARVVDAIEALSAAAATR